MKLIEQQKKKDAEIQELIETMPDAAFFSLYRVMLEEVKKRMMVDRLNPGYIDKLVSGDWEYGDGEQQKCHCYNCATEEERMSTFIACPICGNKRCPHSTYHRNECTGSNEEGQEGSRY